MFHIVEWYSNIALRSTSTIDVFAETGLKNKKKKTKLIL